MMDKSLQSGYLWRFQHSVNREGGGAKGGVEGEEGGLKRARPSPVITACLCQSESFLSLIRTPLDALIHDDVDANLTDCPAQSLKPPGLRASNRPASEPQTARPQSLRPPVSEPPTARPQSLRPPASETPITGLRASDWAIHCLRPVGLETSTAGLRASNRRPQSLQPAASEPPTAGLRASNWRRFNASGGLASSLGPVAPKAPVGNIIDSARKKLIMQPLVLM